MTPLDTFLPAFDVRERFETTIEASPATVMDVAEHFDLQSLALVHGIFRMRERLMGLPPVTRRPAGLREEMTSLGWGVLEDRPGSLLVCGAVCQPWQAQVRFTPLPPAEFVAYTEPGQVKIAWTLEADPRGPASSRFSHETRALATDDEARRQFRRYWRWARVGIVSIRLLLMPAIRRKAEARAAGRA